MVIYRFICDHFTVQYDAVPAVTDHICEIMRFPEGFGLVQCTACADGYEMTCFLKFIDSFLSRRNDFTRCEISKCAVYIKEEIFFFHTVS